MMGITSEFRNRSWPCTALRAQYGQPPAELSRVRKAENPSECKIRICFRKAKYVAIAPSAHLVQPTPTIAQHPFSSSFLKSAEASGLSACRVVDLETNTPNLLPAKRPKTTDVWTLWNYGALWIWTQWIWTRWICTRWLWTRWLWTQWGSNGKQRIGKQRIRATDLGPDKALTGLRTDIEDPTT